MIKNLNISQISYAVTLIFCVINVSFLGLVDIFSSQDFPLYLYLGVLITTVILSILSVKIILEKYLLQKIKLIYKVIHSSKVNPKSNEVDLVNTEMSFDIVNQEVAKWAIDTENEIASLKSLENYRKNYVGNISHELKTPIFSIQGYLHTLLDGALYDDNINLKYLKRAAANADRLQTIIDDLEMINNIQSEIDHLDMEHFDIKELSAEVMSNLEMQAKKKKVKLIFKDDTKTPIMVYADKRMINQVITNLLVNSIKYNKQNGVTRVGFYDMGETILTEVSDDGIGIEEKHLKHLFDRFYRVDSSRARKIGGSGLGLSIVKHIIEAHKQTVNVRSTPNVGSTFGFSLAKLKSRSTN